MKPHRGYQFSEKDLQGYAGFLCNFVRTEDLNHKNVLDVGCGFGWFEHYAAAHNIKKITGIEPVEDNLNIAKLTVANATSNISDKISFLHGSALNLDFLKENFDTVVSWEVLEHIPKNQELVFFKNVSAALKPGGAFYLSTPHSSIVSNLADPAWYFGHRHYNLDALKEYAKTAQLEASVVKIVGSWCMIAYAWNLYISKWIFRRAPFFQDLLLKMLEKELVKSKGFCCNVIRFTKT